MVDLIGALILGIVQGVTEWLPVSSSGHLVLFQEFLGIEAGVSFDLMLHFSTLLVVLTLFRQEALSILRSWGRREFMEGEGRLGLMIILATAFSGLVALFLEQYVAFMFTSTATVGGALLVTGAVIFTGRMERSGPGLDKKRAAFVGIAQGVAVIPGISRSGATVAASLASGLEREKAVRFSFLLSIPAIAGGTAYALKDAASLAAEPLPLAVGMIASFVVGYLSLKWLIRLIIRKRFWMFSIYCWIAGAAVLALSLS